MNKATKKVDLIMDLQFGSTGKGLIAGYLAATRDYDCVINANMPNAGHTFIDEHGNVMVHKVLPNGVVGKKVKKVMIGPDSVFSMRQLKLELDGLSALGYLNWDLIIHENASILLPEHTATEQNSTLLKANGSTKQGSAAAMIDKINRGHSEDFLAKDYTSDFGIMGITVVTNQMWNMYLQEANEILIEGAQGYSLGINAGFYPYCTSRDCTPARIMAGCGVPLPYLRRVVGTARLHPIRVGSPPGGYSGDCYPDQKEVSWEELGVEAERTTVTKRIRRVFTWSQLQMEEALLACMPDEVFLNFCNYDPASVGNTMQNITNAGIKAGKIPDIKYRGWGATVNDVKEGIQDPCTMTYDEKATKGW